MDKKYKLLLVEDEESLRLIYAEYLRMEGFEVIEAVDGEEAVKLINKNTDVDLVLLDLILPKLDGMKVLQKIKSNPKTKHIKVYLTTVLSRDKVIKEGFEHGADGYIIKDTIEPDSLKVEILKALEG